ncbi:type II toxin-antitoxin system RelE family toxin [Syntrophobotulus glycolicus]|nr:type II toxin-antitoxin system RelE/ParE family toxin [Syntrophobotulus glycolicus]
MKYRIEYEKSCVKYLKKLDKNTQIRIINAINQLPFGDIKRLQGSTEDYRLRVGQYRVIFSRYEEELLVKIIQISPRGQIYK